MVRGIVPDDLLNPDSANGQQKLLRYPWPIALRSAQFELLEFLGRSCRRDIQSNPRLEQAHVGTQTEY